MTDPFRSGTFGSVGMGPFDTGGGDFSRYNIADDGDDVALTRKYSAQIAWANGTITDDSYLGALRAYMGTTDKGSRDRISAQNEYDDAVYTIGRNKLVRAVNSAGNTASRVSSLRSLLAYDRRKLGTMKPDNEQARELVDRIADAEAQIRDVRYSDLYRRYKANGVSLASMLAFARLAAASSRGGPDHGTWTQRVDEWEEAASGEEFARLAQEYEHQRIPGATLLSFLKDRMAGMSPDSPAFAEAQRQLEDWTRSITETDRARQNDEMARRVASGQVSNAAYIRYLHTRIADYPKGSSDRRSAEDSYLQAVFKNGESTLIEQIEKGESTNLELAGFYRTYMSSMDPASSRFLELQSRVNDLLVEGAPAFDIGLEGVGGHAGLGHWVDLTGAPGGTPVNAQGYASQFDGSAFASSNCAMASAAMLAWAASGGQVRVSGGDLRYYSGDRDVAGDERGTSFDDITIAYQQVGLGLRQQHGMDFGAWRRRLASGEGSLINGAYSTVPSNLRLSDFQGPHTMYVDRAKKIDGAWFYFVMDPLGRAGYTGQWWPEEAVRQYGWSGVANAGGGTWYGDVAFATKRGRSSSYVNPDRDTPPAQAFDTDWQGRSTQGRGGGKDRAEAGRRRDWSQGRQAEAPTTWPQYQLPPKDVKPTPRPTVSDEQVTDFLAAVDGVQAPTGFELLLPGHRGPTGGRQTVVNGVQQRPGAEPSEDAKRQRARALLEEWGGDGRLAAVAWFTGSVTPDASGWDSTARFYANAVGTRLGYEPVTRGGAVQTTTPSPSPAVPLTPTPAPSPADLVTSGPRPRYEQGRADLSGLAPDAAEAATMLLDELGVDATPDMVRAVVAWMATEGETVTGNNPFVLRTTGSNDLPGQVAKDASSLAIFGTMEDGVRAAADEIRRDHPQLVIAARSGDPERFLVGVDRSGWIEGGYQGTLIRTFNELPGEPGRVIIGGGRRILGGVSGLDGLARLEPSVAEIFDIDPRDPIQMAWLDQNIDAAKKARDGGASTWLFTSPGGPSVELDFTPSVATDLTGIKASYLDWTVAVAPDNATRFKAADAARIAHEDHTRNVVSVASDEWEARMDALERYRDAALGALDHSAYLNATNEMAQATKLYLGIDPVGPLDPTLSPRADILREQGRMDDVIRWGDKLDADPTVSLVDKGYIVPQRDRQGNIVGVSIPPDLAYVAWGKDGKLEQRTVETHPDDFADAQISVYPDPTLENPVVPRRYQQEQVLVTIDGRSGYVPIDGGQARAVVFEAGGYQRVAMPDTGAAAPGAAPGSLTTIKRMSGSAYDYEAGLAAIKSGGGGGTANISSWLMGSGQGNPPVVIDLTTRQDRMPVTAAQPVPVSVLTAMMPDGRLYKWYSIPDGSNTWLGGTTTLAESNPPQLVFGDGASIEGGVLRIRGEEYDAKKHGDRSRYVHWFGTRPTEDGSQPGEMGAPNTTWKLRQGMFAPGGGVSLDTGRADDPIQAYYEGDSSYEELVATLGRPPSTRPFRGVPQRGGNPPAKPGSVATSDATWSSGGGGKGGPTREWQAPVDEGLRVATSGQAPMNAGVKPTPATRPSALGSIVTRLAASVTTGAQNAANMAVAAQQRAAARAASLERVAALQRAQAAQRRQQDMAARIAAEVTPTPAPRRTPAPAPQAGPQPGPSPSPRPAPNPPPTPPRPPARPQQQGNY